MTHKITDADKKNLTPEKDSGFRLVIIVSTTFVFAAAFGWLGCIERKEAGEVEFHWQWRALFWIGVGIASTIYFWRQVWPGHDDSNVGRRKRMIKGWVVLLIPSLMWMAYPLLFISGQQLLNVFIGLAVAATVLTFGGWMIFRLIKGFANDEIPTDIANLSSHPNSSKADANTPPTA